MTTALPTRPRAALRISRRDVVNQIVANARAQNLKAIEATKKLRDAACQAFVQAVCDAAMEAAAPAIEVLNRVGSRKGAYQASYSFDPSIRDDGDGNRRFEGMRSSVHVDITDKERNGHYDRDYNRFNVEVKLSKELLALRDAALKLVMELADLRLIERESTREQAMRVSRKLLNQAIKDLPEGEALLDLMDGLRKRVEKETGKHLLLGE